jgi:membrane protease YdiL (CAAX protease family)
MTRQYGGTMTFIQSPGRSGGLWSVLYGPRELRAGWRFLIFLAIVAGLIAATNALIALAFGKIDGSTSVLVRKILNFTCFLLASLIMGKLEGRTLADYGLPPQRAFGFHFWQGVLLGFAGLTLLLGIMWAAGAFHITGLALHGAEAWKWAGLYGFAFVIVGLEEEFRYRGYAQFTLSTGMGFWPTAFCFSALFGAGHIANSGETWVGALNAGVAGLFFALLLRRSGSLWLPIGTHAAWDWAESYFYGVPDSGFVLPGHLLDSTFEGSKWITGGTVGPEGSLLCTLVLAVMAGVAALWLRETRFPLPARSVAEQV